MKILARNELKQVTLEKGDCTFEMGDRIIPLSPSSGYSVGTGLVVVCPPRLFHDALRMMMAQYGHGQTYGTWIDGQGRIVIDAVMLHTDLQSALAHAKANLQESIWDFGGNRELKVGSATKEVVWEFRVAGLSDQLLRWVAASSIEEAKLTLLKYEPDIEVVSCEPTEHDPNNAGVDYYAVPM